MSFDPLERYQTLYGDDDFTLGVSWHLIEGEERPHVHVDVRKFSPSVLRRMDRVFAEIRPTLPAVIGAILNHTSKVGPKFMSRYGWIPAGSVPWPGSDVHHTFWVMKEIRSPAG